MGLFRRSPEKRASGGGYTDLIIESVELAAAATTVNAAATAAAEVAAGLIGRALAQATVTAPDWAAAAIGPRWLRRVAYDLICTTAGHLSAIELRNDRLEFDVSSNWTWYGTGADPRTWSVLAELPRPTGNETRRIPAAGVVAIGWSDSRFQPWYGLSPLGRARLTAQLLGRLDDKLGQEAGGQVGHLVTLPRARSRDSGESFDGRLAVLDELRGKTVSLPGAGGFDPAGGNTGSQFDTTPRRVGADPPEALVALQAAAYSQVLAACGVPADLGSVTGAGSQARESYRRFVILTVEPLAGIVAEELSLKLETPVSLAFDRLAHADIAGRARAAASLVKSGWSPQEAAAAVGLDAPAAQPEPAPEPVPSAA